MSIKILTDKDTFQSVMYDSNSEIAFGPVFGEDENPQDFTDWFKRDYLYEPQIYHSDVLGKAATMWRKEVKENEAEAAGERHFTEPGAWSGGFAKNH